jgi:Na+/H+-dicarboxylate symporter
LHLQWRAGWRKPNSQQGLVSSSNKILIGLFAGIFAGVFLGEHAGVFRPVAEGFIKLLQMTVLPYITLSILSSVAV